MADKSSTMLFSSAEIEQEYIHQLLVSVEAALKERGYNAVNQLSGYLLSGDPAYISSHNGARANIQKVERFEIIEELVRHYLESK